MPLLLGGASWACYIFPAEWGGHCDQIEEGARPDDLPPKKGVGIESIDGNRGIVSSRCDQACQSRSTGGRSLIAT